MLRDSIFSSKKTSGVGKPILIIPELSCVLISMVPSSLTKRVLFEINIGKRKAFLILKYTRLKYKLLWQMDQVFSVNS